MSQIVNLIQLWYWGAHRLWELNWCIFRVQMKFVNIRGYFLAYLCRIIHIYIYIRAYTHCVTRYWLYFRINFHQYQKTLQHIQCLLVSKTTVSYINDNKKKKRFHSSPWKRVISVFAECWYWQNMYENKRTEKLRRRKIYM